MAQQLAEVDLQLPWDYFLEKAVASAVRDPADGPQRKVLLLRHINAFREIEWPNIKRQLAQEFQYEVPDGLEPHWIGGGRAVLWQEQVQRQRVSKVDGQGRPYNAVEEKSLGWQPLNGGIACNNASIIASYLKKGLRFRPPSAGVDVVFKAAVPASAPQAVAEQFPYECQRHDGRKAFRTWRAYVQHCTVNQETVEAAAPQEVLDLMRKSKYFCALHMKGFTSAKAAKHHYTVEIRRPGRRLHPSLADMEVKL